METRICSQCKTEKPLDEFYIRKTGKHAGKPFRECITCDKARVLIYSEAHRERARARANEYRETHKDKIGAYNKDHYDAEYMRQYRLTHKTKRRYKHKAKIRTASDCAKDSATYLGVYVAERALSKFFDNIQRMPHNNPGYDFLCGRGFKIDVKSACLRQNTRSTNFGWVFSPQRNQVADYFLCLGFDNRESLNPIHVWLIPGRVINNQVTVSITNIEASLSKWTQYERALDRVLMCCAEMKKSN